MPVLRGASWVPTVPGPRLLHPLLPPRKLMLPLAPSTPGAVEAPGKGLGPKVPLLPTQEADAVREVLAPSLACAAAHAGDLEALRALEELVSPLPTLGDQHSHTRPREGALASCRQDGLAGAPSPLHPDLPGLEATAGASVQLRRGTWPLGAPHLSLSLPCGLPGLPGALLVVKAPVSPQGSDLSLEDFGGQTPLHAAARGGHVGTVTMLLQRGLDANARDKDGLSPLLLAVRGRYSGQGAGPCG